MERQIRYVTSADGTRIACSLYGDGAGTPILMVYGWPASDEMSWGSPGGRALFEALAQGRRLVGFDRRGLGASQREVEDLSPEAHVADLTAVADHLRLERFHLLDVSDGSAVIVAYAVQYPARVGRMILCLPFARGLDLVDLQAHLSMTDLVRTNWSLARRALASLMYPAGPPEMQRWYSSALRDSVSPETLARYMDLARNSDITPLLPRVQAPALVLARSGNSFVPVRASREVAALIPDSRLVVTEGNNIVLGPSSDPGIEESIRQFLREGEEAAETTVPASGLVTILFTDMEGSTALTQRLGDAGAQELVRAHNTIVREALKAHGGSEIKHTGDGIMASFASPSRAIECAIAIQRGVEAWNQDVGAALAPPQGAASSAPTEAICVRIGLNAGEPVAEEGDLFGTAVQLARRICDRAEAGQVLVADVVRQLASGKGFLFSDVGDVVVKGFEDPVRLYEVRWREERTTM